MLIVLLSGGVSSGKSTLSEKLREQYGFELLKTKTVIQERAKKELGRELTPSRRAMQNFGDSLDVRTDGKWVLQALTSFIRKSSSSSERIVVDAVRILKQIVAIRKAYGFPVVHIHLKAPDDVLAVRYSERKNSGLKELSSYAAVERNRTEARVNELEDSADVVIDTARCTAADVLIRAAAHLSLFSRDYARMVDVIVGVQYGSEGKGHIASFLSREYSLLVRVGGPNAGHKVYEFPEPYTPNHFLRVPCEIPLQNSYFHQVVFLTLLN